MAKIIGHPKVKLQIQYVLTESESRALDALAGYGVDAFLQVFYEHLGQAYMKPHEAGLRSLFESVRSEIPVLLERARVAREAFNA